MNKKPTYYVRQLASQLKVSEQCAEQIKDLRATNKNSQVLEDRLIKKDQQQKTAQYN